MSRWQELMTELDFKTGGGKAALFQLIGKTREQCIEMAGLPEAERANTLKMWLAELHLKNVESGREGGKESSSRYSCVLVGCVGASSSSTTTSSSSPSFSSSTYCTMALLAPKLSRPTDHLVRLARQTKTPTPDPFPPPA